jgi:hypothetical protein
VQSKPVITNGTGAGAHLRNLVRYFGDPNASIDLSTIGLGNPKTIVYFKSKNIFNKMMVAYGADWSQASRLASVGIP